MKLKIEDFVLHKMLGKGSFGKVWHRAMGREPRAGGPQCGPTLCGRQGCRSGRAGEPGAPGRAASASWELWLPAVSPRRRPSRERVRWVASLDMRPGEQPQWAPSSRGFSLGWRFLVVVVLPLSQTRSVFYSSGILCLYRMASAVSELARTTGTKWRRLAASIANVISQSQRGVRSGVCRPGPQPLPACPRGRPSVHVWVRATSVTSF